MKAIIPVAGVGTRLRPHTHTAPKVLLQVAGKPILGHIIDELITLGVTNISFIVGYLGQMVQDYVEDNYPMLTSRFIEQEHRGGLGHAIWLARDHHASAGPLLIILGDTIFQADLCAALSSDRTLIGVKEVADPSQFGIVETGPDGRVTGLVEKPEHPKTNLAIVGIYVIRTPRLLFESLDRLIQEDIRTKGEYQLTDALQLMLKAGERMETFPVQGWLDCGKPETLLETNRVLLEQKFRTLPERKAALLKDSIVRPPVAIAETASVTNSIVGPYVSISEGAEVSNSIVANSIISKDAAVLNAILDASIVSDRARVKGQHLRLNVGDSSEILFE